MPLVSVITPTQAHNAEHLLAAWTSIAGQELPGEWEFEWLVQEDGLAPCLRERLPADDRVRYDALGVQAGAPATRNHALARARGSAVAGLDHDDLYDPGGLGALLRPLIARPLIAWSCGRVRWEMEDGSTWTKADVLGPGPVPVGRVTDHFLAHDDFPFPAAMAAYRRTELLAAGGWPALVRSADAALLAWFSDQHPGWWVDQDVAVYRRWSRQKTVQPAEWAIRDLPHVRGWIGLRRQAAALSRLGAGPPPPAD